MSHPVRVRDDGAVFDVAELPQAEGLRRERELAAACIASAEGVEGVAAFREHRPPAFAHGAR